MRLATEEDTMEKGRSEKLHALFAATFFAVLLGQPGVGHTQEEQPMLALGKDLFIRYCAACHGESGKGDGPVGATLKKPPADLTQISQKHGGTFPRAKVRQFIDGERPVPAHGLRQMPIWGKVFREEKPDSEARMRIFALTVFLESIQAQ